MVNTGQRMGIANLPLPYGEVPPWRFEPMYRLAREREFGVQRHNGVILTTGYRIIR